ncbi:L-threonylcarbamoyladenylate synthase [Thermoproteota archaeon]
MKTRVVKIHRDFPESQYIKLAVKLLKGGGLVAFPTETVYGLGVNKNNKKAVEKIYKVKNREADKPLSILAGDIRDVDNIAKSVLPAAHRLLDKFWPGPLTIILEGKDSKKIGLRMPRSAVALEIVRNANFPVACPSANMSGDKESLNAGEVSKAFDGKIDLILDGGDVELGVASTVVDVCSLPFKVLRKGFVSEESISDISSKKRVLFVCLGNSCRSVMAEALFKKELEVRNRNDVEVISAGVNASIDMGASPDTRKLLAEEGIDVSNHRSQRVNQDILKGCDLILVMERFQEKAILTSSPFLENRVYLLKEFSKFTKGSLEVEDPMGMGTGVYKRVFVDIKEAILRLIDLI